MNVKEVIKIKIMFLGMAKLKYMPYIHFYLDQINLEEHETHIFYWNRDTQDDCNIDSRVGLHCLQAQINDGDRLKKKIPLFRKYRKHAIKTIKTVKPDLLIVHYQTTGVLLYDYLTRKYKGKYILDYRDVTYERNGLFRKMVARLVNCSYATFISSNGFRKFLPKSDKIYPSHNLLKDSLKERERYLSERIPSSKIRVAFWGLIRHEGINRALIENLGKDDRFELHYYGRAQGKMLQLLNDSVKKYPNVFYHGVYAAEDRYDFAKNTDILHNVYDNDDKTMPVAMSNKFYDGPIFYLPQLCMRDSFMAETCNRYNIGLACNPCDEDFVNCLYEYYTNLDKDAFNRSADAFLQTIQSDLQKAEEIIEAFIHC